jgi:hypothetical protein
MGKQQTRDRIPPDAACDLISAEIRTRFLAAADDAIADFDPSAPLPAAVGAASEQFGYNATSRMVALVRGIGTPTPPAGLVAACAGLWAESNEKVTQGLVAKLHAYSEGLWDEIDRLQAEQDRIEAEITRMMLEGKRSTKKRRAIMLSLATTAPPVFAKSRICTPRWRTYTRRKTYQKPLQALERRPPHDNRHN